jgi:hypothetical protein
MAALDDRVERDRHVVAQVVEPELGVRAVGDVGLVGDLAAIVRQFLDFWLLATGKYEQGMQEIFRGES